MKCCINPQCPNPHNPDQVVYCQACGVKITDLLRGRFRIIQLLGQGGFGRTYLAEDIDKLNDKCVVKQFVPLMQGTGALQKAIQLFEQEAKQLLQLGHHRQIPTLSAYFLDNNQLYLVQEYIEGETLQEIVEKQGIWTEQQVKELLTGLLPVLQFIHEKNVIHRDLKPDNIIRRRNGEYVLIDFGVAKDLSATVIYTQVGTRVGSDGYAAREQILGGEVYPASDLYSLGVICFYLLTLVSPLKLTLDEGYSWTNNWQQYLKQNISAEFKTILDKLLQKEIDDRYSSAEEVLQKLQPRNQTLITSSPTVPTVSLSPPISWQNAALITTLTGHSNAVLSVAISPDSRILASGSWDKTIKLWDVSRRQQIATLTGHLHWVYSVAISPDSRMLASGSDDNTIKLWDIPTQQEIATLTGHSRSVMSVAISPDGRILASGSWGKTIKLWDIPSQRRIATLTGHSNEVNSVTFSLDGRMLASGSSDHTIKLWDVPSQQQITTLTGHSDLVVSVAFSPDGRTLASGSYDDHAIKLWDVPSQREIATLTGHSKAVMSVVFSSDGRMLASGSSDNRIKLWRAP